MLTKNKNITKILSIFVLATVVLTQILPLSMANAVALSPRSLTLSSGSNGDAGAKVSGTVNHDFSFKMATPGSDIGSVRLQYCTTAAAVPAGLDCTTPPGLNTQNAGPTPPATALANQAGVTGFTIAGGSTNGNMILTRTHAVVSGSPTISFTLQNVTNPSTNPITNSGTFFVRVSVYASEDGTGTAIDSGTVAASTVTQIQLSGIMPESLVFCVGKTVAKTDGVPDCRTVTTGLITFNQLFSPSDTAFATSQMAASTNAATGYVVTVNGNTLESGGNSIAQMSSTAVPVHGIAQFGLNLVANTGIGAGAVVYASAGAFGSAVDLAANGTNLKGQPVAATYGVAEQFKYTTGDPVAKSDNVVAGPSDSQIFTTSYIANVTGSQPAGTYSTTLTYICTPTF